MYTTVPPRYTDLACYIVVFNEFCFHTVSVCVANSSSQVPGFSVKSLDIKRRLCNVKYSTVLRSLSQDAESLWQDEN